jgi:hypothetical protein
MRRTIALLAAATLAITMAACGGDDDGPLGDATDPPTADDTDPADDEAETGPPPEAPAPDEQPDSPDAPDSPDGPDLGDLGDLGIDLDELAELGIDLSDLEEMLGNLDGIDFENFDPETDLAELFEGLDDFISGFGGDGGGTVTVDGVTYQVESDSCITFGDDFFMDGPAAGSDGSQAWVVVSRDITTRADMEDFMDEAMLDNLFGDSDVLDEAYVEVHVGSTSRFDFTDDQPSWNAMSDSGWAFGDGIIEFQMTGNGIRGAGQAEDQNGVAAEWGETVPIEFEVGCS